MTDLYPGLCDTATNKIQEKTNRNVLHSKDLTLTLLHSLL